MKQLSPFGEHNGVIASATKGQSRLIISEKVKKEILPRSPLLKMEIENIKDNANDTEITFHNTSSIVVVPASENARGYRATVFLYEEFRMIPKRIIDSVLSPFLVVRPVDYINKFEEYAPLVEEPKQIYISSAWTRSHWMWGLVKNFAQDMLTDQSSFLIAMDYSIVLRHNIKTRDFLTKERVKLDPTSWATEYENIMLEENEHAYFTYDMLKKNRSMVRAFYPRQNDDVISKVKNRYAIPKQPGEVRIISCDIASAGGKNNDNSVFSCIRALPETKEYKVSNKDGDHIEVKQGYKRQVVYLEAQQEFETTKQAIRIKELFEDFDADYCVLDTRNTGRLMPSYVETRRQTVR